MLKNYFITALRNLFRHRLYSVINIGGLAVGLAASILILLYAWDELSYDNWLPGADEIYRMHSTFKIPGRDPFATVRSSGRIFYSIPENVPEAAEVTRIFPDGVVVRQGDSAFPESFSWVDPNFFDVFDLPFLYGNKKTALVDLSSIVLSETMARKYFGDTNPIGQTLPLCCNNGDIKDYKVTAVIRDIPANSHLDLQLITLVDREGFSGNPSMTESWTSVNAYTYFTLEPGATIEELENNIYRVLEANIEIPPDLGLGALRSFYILSFMKVSDIHLDALEQAADIGDMRPLGDKETLYGLIAIAGLVLAIASINFMNLATARATQRAREVSLRKVLGADRTDLIRQFLSESVIVTLLAFLLALALVELTLPWYSGFLERELALDIFTSPALFFSLLTGALVIGIGSGFYPAMVLSGFRPARILKANQSADPEGRGRLRQVLVVAQFAISIGLAVMTAIIYSQTIYVKNSDLGFERDNRIILRRMAAPGRSGVRDAMIDNMLRHPEITGAVLSSEVPTDNPENNTGFSILGRDDRGTMVLNYTATDYGFMESYGIRPVAGRLFSEDFGTDALVPSGAEDERVEASVVINEAAARRLGFATPEEALGEILLGGVGGVDDAALTIVGVIPNIRFRSLRFGVRPNMYIHMADRFRTLTITYDTDDVAALMQDIEAIWKTHAPAVPFRQDFLSDMIAQQYTAEDRQGTLFAVFAGFAIFIASLGLFGLAAFSAQRRTKEIGIRKVMGARVMDIVRLLVWQFSKPVLIANLIAWPVAGYFMKGWLEGFEQRLDFTDPMFLVSYFGGAGAIALLIAWITVAGHATRVARTNPVHALRYE